MTHTDPKTPSLRERIEEIVVDVYTRTTPSLKDGVDQILLAVKEAMPCRVERSSNDQDDSYCVVWNACIEEMEKRCE